MIEVKDLSKRFDSLVVLDRVTFQISDASLVVVLGPSGTGKSVLLKAMLGLMPVDGGEVLFDEKSIQTASELEIYNIRKKVGFVFQGTALFDSMNVCDNIALPLIEHTRLSSKEVKDRVCHLLDVVGMAVSFRIANGTLPNLDPDDSPGARALALGDLAAEQLRDIRLGAGLRSPGARDVRGYRAARYHRQLRGSSHDML